MEMAGPYVCPRIGPQGKEGQSTGSHTERQGSGSHFFTLTCRDVAVSPVDPIFIFCDVAPRLNVSVRIPAETQRGKFDR